MINKCTIKLCVILAALSATCTTLSSQNNSDCFYTARISTVCDNAHGSTISSRVYPFENYNIKEILHVLVHAEYSAEENLKRNCNSKSAITCKNKSIKIKKIERPMNEKEKKTVQLIKEKKITRIIKEEEKESERNYKKWLKGTQPKRRKQQKRKKYNKGPNV